MGRLLAHDPAREVDLVIRDAVLAGVENDGHTIPCRSLPARVTSAWADDEDDPRAGALAALACAGCPLAAFTACETFAQAHPAEVGVLAGTTRADRTKARRTGRPPRAARSTAA